MSHPKELKQWVSEVSRQMPHLSKPQAWVLALYSYGMAMTQRCGLTTISVFLGLLLEQSPNTLRQRLREWTYEAEQKRGEQRCELEVSASFAPLLNWILTRWQDSQLVLAMDVTYLGERFTILAISVLYRQCAIPVAWYILPGNTKQPWHPLWVQLFNQLKPAISSRVPVFVLADRGLYSKRLFQVLEQKGWHPLMRIRAQGKYRLVGGKQWRSLAKRGRRGMRVWAFRVWCFKGDPLECTLVVDWQSEYDEPWLIVTTLLPKQIRPNLYGLRVWIEAGFKDLKRGGLRWEQTKMTDPRRVERLWLVMAVALMWLIRIGGQCQLFGFHWHSPDAFSRLSCVTTGWLVLLVSALKNQPVPDGYFAPYIEDYYVPI